MDHDPVPPEIRARMDAANPAAAAATAALQFELNAIILPTELLTELRAVGGQTAEDAVLVWKLVHMAGPEGVERVRAVYDSRLNPERGSAAVDLLVTLDALGIRLGHLPVDGSVEPWRDLVWVVS